MTPLHNAAEGGHLEAVQALLAAGADVHAKAVSWGVEGALCEWMCGVLR